MTPLGEAAIIFASGAVVGAMLSAAWVWTELAEIRRQCSIAVGRVIALKTVLRPFVQHVIPQEDWICHKGICSMEQCSHCQRILKARAVLFLDDVEDVLGRAAREDADAASIH